MLIAQITDTHIVDKHTHWLSEPSTKTDQRLAKAVSYINALNPMPDVVLFTGDTSDKGTQGSYCHLQELIEPLKVPLFIIPGNHDCREKLRKTFSNQPYMPAEGFIHYAINDYPVRLIGLDTHVEGESFGQICEKRFAWLNQVMEIEKEKPSLIFMHHPPAKTGTKVFDRMSCQMPPGFEHFISTQNNLLGIISGHYHHLCVTSCGGKPCFIAPSVAPVHYFANPHDDYVTALEIEDPAIALHQWHGNQVMTSHVIRLKEQHHRIDWISIKNRKAS